MMFIFYFYFILVCGEFFMNAGDLLTGFPNRVKISSCGFVQTYDRKVHIGIRQYLLYKIHLHTFMSHRKN